MSGMLRVRRSRGALSGALLILLGAWGAIVAFIGPTFGYAYTPNTAWTYTTGRLWLEILPGIGALLGGLVLLVSASRPATLLGAWLGAASGAWFIVGNVIVPTWFNGRINAGAPVGTTSMRALEDLGFFIGLGAVIVFLAASALGRLSVIAVRDRRVPSPAGAAVTDGAATQASTASTARGTNRSTTSATLAKWRLAVAGRRSSAAAAEPAAQDERAAADR